MTWGQSLLRSWVTRLERESPSHISSTHTALLMTPTSCFFKAKELFKQPECKLFRLLWFFLRFSNRALPCGCWLLLFSRSVMSDSLQLHGPYSSWNSLGQNTGVGSVSLLQGIFPTQESNPGLPHCRLILYQLSHKGSPRILEWVANPFSSGSSWPKNQPRVSCIAGGFFTNLAIREAHYKERIPIK